MLPALTATLGISIGETNNWKCMCVWRGSPQTGSGPELSTGLPNHRGSAISHTAPEAPQGIMPATSQNGLGVSKSWWDVFYVLLSVRFFISECMSRLLKRTRFLLVYWKISNKSNCTHWVNKIERNIITSNVKFIHF